MHWFVSNICRAICFGCICKNNTTHGNVLVKEKVSFLLCVHILMDSSINLQLTACDFSSNLIILALRQVMKVFLQFIVHAFIELPLHFLMPCKMVLRNYRSNHLRFSLIGSESNSSALLCVDTKFEFPTKLLHFAPFIVVLAINGW